MATKPVILREEDTQTAVAPVPQRRRRAFWAVWLLPVIVAGLVATWFWTRERLPPVIRIATAAPGGEYHMVATVLAEQLERRTGRKVKVLESQGSVSNRRLLESGAADLAVMQVGSVGLEDLAIVAPIYHDVVHVVVRAGRDITSMHDLDQRRVALGPPGSGMHASALEILRFYEVDPTRLSGVDTYFLELRSNDSFDAAIVTTGHLNADLRRLLKDGRFEILPVQDAAAIALTHPYLSERTIPRGLYGTRPTLPRRPVRTLATTAVLAAGPNAPRPLIEHALAGLFEGSLRVKIPDMFTPAEVRGWHELSLHPATRAYFNPNEGLRVLGAFIESLAGIKELLFAFGAGVYALWLWRRRRAEERQRQELRRQRDRLDQLLKQTVRIERAQMGTDDAIKLRAFLDDITRIKLEALDELSHEELRGDRVFSIFLMQCSNLIRKIQSKIGLHQHSEA